MEIRKIKLSDIEQNENSRVIYKSTELADLMRSMEQDGLLQPVGVRQLSNGRYDAIFGNRRIMAAKKLGWASINATIVEAATDNDRDILNLVENFKRQQTSVSEDGRIFQKLVDNDLSPKEIAARLGISDARIQTALDVFNEFPMEFKPLIVNKQQGKNIKGKISASTAFMVNNIRKSNKLNRGQMRTLLKYSMQSGVGQPQLNSIAPLLRSGMDLQKAIGVANKIESFGITLQIDREHAERLEKKHKKSLQEICYELIESQKDLKITRSTYKAQMGTSIRLTEKHA